jgi:hypothetical protein
LTSKPSLWSIDDERRLWDKTEIDVSRSGDQTSPTFAVYENWAPVLDLLRIKHEPFTWAFRDWRSGSVVFRCWQNLDLHCVSDDGRRYVTHDGYVYSFPPPANWLLLLLGQSILATPLILVWLVLYWRRRRLARRRSAEAP